MILLNGWHTKQVDYTTEFSQIDLKLKVLIECPRGLCFKDSKDKVMKLINILYSFKQASRKFFENSGMDFLNEASFNPKWIISYLWSHTWSV